MSHLRGSIKKVLVTVGVRKVLLTALKFHAKIATQPYFVGPELQDALRASRRLEGLRIATTVAYWNDLEEIGRAHV